MTNEIRKIMALLAEGKISLDKAKEMAGRYVFDPRFVSGEIEHFKATIKHRIGRCMVTRYVSRKRVIWEVYWQGVMVATSNDGLVAMALAKNRRPRPNKKVTQEIIAYRGWGLVGDILVPVTRQDDLEVWDGPVATSDEVPSLHNHSGLYAAKLPYAQQLVDSYGNMVVHGLVGLLGTVCEHERGYRAEKQIVRVLRVVPKVGDGLLKVLEERYQCQVFRFSGKARLSRDDF